MLLDLAFHSFRSRVPPLFTDSITPLDVTEVVLNSFPLGAASLNFLTLEGLSARLTSGRLGMDLAGFGTFSLLSSFFRSLSTQADRSFFYDPGRGPFASNSLSLPETLLRAFVDFPPTLSFRGFAPRGRLQWGSFSEGFGRS